MKRRNQSGVALVTTLIMLSVITFTAVVFLALAMRNKDSVIVYEETTSAKDMNASAMAMAQNDLMAHLLATTNFLGYDMLVSRTYSPNVLTGAPTPGSEVGSAVTNLIYESRPPVYVQTNSNPSLPWEYRYWLDLTRDGQFQPSGYLRELDNFGVPTSVTNWIVGEPEWKGVLQYPFATNFGGLPPQHSRSNKFIGRVAYMILPYGKSLSANYIHNDAKQLSPGMDSYQIVGNPAISGDGFRRNQGSSSAELNLAAFLAQLNQNVWGPGYSYDTNLAQANLGRAFDDALALLSYRYQGYTNLPPFSDPNFMYGNVGGNAISTDLIDTYLKQPLMGLTLPTNDVDNLYVAVTGTPTPWYGAPTTNRNRDGKYFDLVSELFVTNRSYSTPLVYSNFLYNLRLASTNSQSTYDRYTLMRFLAQMGTETAPPTDGRLNLNYNNIGTNSATNFVGWLPVDFFNEAAEHLLRTNFDYSLLDTTYSNRVEIYPTNRYTAAMHRMFQLTANIYDATTNRGTTYPFYPSVFRPVFTNSNGKVTILRYEEVTNRTPVFFSYLTREEAGDTNGALGYLNTTISNKNIWGVPWVVGAKKGHPAFNEFALRSAIQVSRRLEVIKANTNTPVTLTQTNQMYVLGISNLLGMEFWNPYTNTYPTTNNVVLYTHMDTFASLTNQSATLRTFTFSTIRSNYVALNAWAGNQFVLPINTNFTFLPDAQFFDSTQAFLPLTNIPPAYTNSYERGRGFYVPRWSYSMTNRLFSVLFDGVNDRVIDYVNYDNFTFAIDDLSASLVNANAYPGGASAGVNTALIQDLFRTNRIGGTTSNYPTEGVRQQLFVGMGNRQVSQQDWNNYGLQNLSVQDKNLAIATFQRFMGQTVRVPGSPYHSNPGGPPQYYVKMPPSTNMQVPFSAVAKIVFTNYWQANDPIVHYTMQDMGDTGGVNTPPFLIRPSSAPMVTNNLGFINDRYRPWGVRQGRGTSALLAYDPPTPVDYTYEYRVKDPQVRKADDWDFPGQKFANIGWLGRVHRGTPWQTVYMKAGVMPDENPGNEWRRWSGNAFTHPTNDWLLPDLFTVAMDDNASLGLLSINQGNYASWAAVLGSVMVVSNTVDFNNFSTNTPFVPPAYTNLFIDPTSAQLKTIVDGINAVRSNRVATLGGGLLTTNAFTRMGQILSVPQLSVGNTPAEASPYLSLFDTNMLYGVSDAAIERIPQQVLSLLKVDDVPRVVIYAWGQALKPAPNSVILSGAARGVVTNYQVASEYATRTVLRIEGAPKNPRVVVENFTVLPSE